LSDFPDRIAAAVLLDEGLHLANTVRITHLDADGRGLSKNGNRRRDIHDRWRRTAGKKSKRQEKYRNQDGKKNFSHKLF
jgi:hypothetical protein